MSKIRTHNNQRHRICAPVLRALFALGKSMRLFATLMLCISIESLAVEPKSFEGDWVVNKHIPARGVSAITYDEADTLSGTKVSYGNKSAQFGDEYCKSPSYDIHAMNEDEFFRITYSSFDELGFDNEVVYEVNIKCSSHTKDWYRGSSFFYSSDNRLLIVIEGIWVELLRKRT